MAKIMSEELKMKLAGRLGVADTVAREGWGSVPSRECGNLVKLAIEEAERSLTQRTGGGGVQ